MHIPKIIAIVDSIFAGAGIAQNLTQMRNETITLLYQIIQEGDDEEIPQMIKEICESIASVLSAEGKEVDPEACQDMLLQTVMEERAKFKARMMMHRLYRRRRGRRFMEEF